MWCYAKPSKDMSSSITVLGPRRGTTEEGETMSLFDVPEAVLDARPPGAKDFDFLQGRWLIRHKKLAERLVGCDTWSEFETPAANQLILGGLGNIDHIRIETGEYFEGASLRLFDKTAGL